jgi:hypothetical protein
VRDQPINQHMTNEVGIQRWTWNPQNKKQKEMEKAPRESREGCSNERQIVHPFQPSGASHLRSGERSSDAELYLGKKPDQCVTNRLSNAKVSCHTGDHCTRVLRWPSGGKRD